MKSGLQATLAILAAPLTGVYWSATQLKNHLYDAGLLKSHRSSIPVISVGNLTFGGTGKTPVTSYLVSRFSEKRNVAIVCRSYKGTATKAQVVDLSLEDATQVFGDEACLLKQKNPQCLVVSGPSKTQCVKFIEKNYRRKSKEMSVHLIVVDDGFQHRKLHRDLDIVLIDSSTKLSELSWPLFGRLREGTSSLKRAQAIFLTKTENKNSQLAASVLEIAEQMDLPVWEWRGKAQLSDRQSSHVQSQKAGLISGIAKPDSFGRIFSSDCSWPHLKFPDHAVYSANDLPKIQDWIAENQVERVFCTEKDYIKLKSIWNLETPLECTSFAAEPVGDLKELYEKVDQLFIQRP